jgi:hypothetical protein
MSSVIEGAHTLTHLDWLSGLIRTSFSLAFRYYTVLQSIRPNIKPTVPCKALILQGLMHMVCAEKYIVEPSGKHQHHQQFLLNSHPAVWDQGAAPCSGSYCEPA